MNRITQGTFAWLTVLLTSQALASEPAPTDPAPDQPTAVHLRSVTYNGIGCPPGNADFQATYDPMGHGLKMTMTQIVAEWGAGISLAQSRRNCTLSIDLGGTEGWQYALSRFKTSGFVDLDPGVNSEIKLYSFFDGSPSQSVSRVYKGPIRTEFEAQDVWPLTTLQWSNCETPRKLNVNFAIKVFPDRPAPKPNMNAVGSMLIGSEWSSAGLDLGLVWRRCPS
ncbi:MAG TPA: DUF4360 domain-containing protein [Oligoflexus sp.]|uniref:DUF4360 domain-containing protein n=1 Tax=Oligoflexus sp. TaxID=1971216 RepID=UPI002D687E9D|nr:DUF4360 domain-containing protein [Oligoflexus sp.]HYX36533.1 DUF4360 domain-containing protein [Oligoflexus sp.]